MTYGYRRRYYRKRPTSSRRRKYSPKVSRTTYKKTARIVKSVMNRNTETKRHVQTFNSVNFAANGVTTGTDGHVLTNIAIPSVGTAQNQRIGNRIRNVGFKFNYLVNTASSANANYPLTGRIYFLLNREGGTSFPIGNFLENDPNRTSITYNSLRNPDFFKDFVVLRSQRIRLGQDTYQANFDQLSGSITWKGNIPTCINSSTPTTNSLFLLFVADSGFTTSGVNPTNYFQLAGQSILYFKDD